MRAPRPRKTHETAVVAIPPPEIWEPIQQIRRLYDRKLNRWMPHVTLLYPFRPRGEFDAARCAVARACARVAPFGTVLARFCAFSHGRGRHTVWLAPEPPEPFRALAAALLAEFPDCDDTFRRGGGAFMPHLSVGQLEGPPARVRAQLAELERAWRPLSFSVRDVALIEREGDCPFEIAARVPLGG